MIGSSGDFSRFGFYSHSGEEFPSLLIEPLDIR